MSVSAPDYSLPVRPEKTTGVDFYAVNCVNNLAVGGNATITGNLTVTGTQTLTGAQTLTGLMTCNGGLAVNGVTTMLTASANALSVGRQGATNPAFNIDASASNSATGVNVAAAAAGSGVAVSALSSGTDENLKIDAKGAGLTVIGGTSTGLVSIGRGSVKGPVLSLTKTDVNSQNAAPTAAQWLGGYITHNSQTGGGTLTTPTGAQLSAAVSGVAVGDSFLVMYQNRGNQTVTLTAGDGNVTLKGTVAVPTLKTSWILFTNTGTNTWDACQVLGA